MTPVAPNPNVVERRLALQRGLLHEMRKLQPLSVERLASEPVIRAAIERMMQSIVDLALDINSHIASSVLERAPSTGRESFDLMVTMGIIETEHADRLKPAVGLRNVLVHMYADIDVALIADSIDAFEAMFSSYVRVVAQWLLRRVE